MIPNEVVEEVGKVTIIGTALEETIYLVADALNLTTRTGPASSAAAEAIKVVRKRGVPPWARIDPEEVTEWLTSAKKALGRRNRVVHSRYSWIAAEGTWVGHSQRTNGREDSKNLSADELSDVRSDLERATAGGSEVHVGLLPELAPRVYEYYYGPNSGVIIARYEHGEWPERPTDDQLSQWRKELHQSVPEYTHPDSGV